MTSGHETQTPLPEQIRSSEEIASTLAKAHVAVARLQQDPHFHASCVEVGIDPLHGTATSEYWHTFRRYVDERAETARQEGHDSLWVDSIDLLANAPAYFMEQAKLSSGEKLPYHELRSGKEMVSHYNGLIRDFAIRYPETSVSTLTQALMVVIAHSIPGKHLRGVAASQLKQTIRGAQHELGFSQILSAADLLFRPASVDEDLKGVDYAIYTAEGELGVDVKASLSEIESRGSDRAFAVKPGGKVVMYSMIHDQEFNDRFFIDQAAAEMKAPMLAQQLQQAQQQAKSA